MATLKVGADGKAPSNAKVGDTIVTAGGNYKIQGTKADGGWDAVKEVTPTAATVTPATQKVASDDERQAVMFKAAEEVTKSRLAADRDAKLSAIAKQRAAIPNIYNQQRAQTTGTSESTGRQFQQLLAEKGISGGANAEAAMQQASELRGQMGAIGMAQGQAEANLNEDERLAMMGYETDLAGAKNTLLQQQLQAQIDQDYKTKQLGLQEAGLTGMYNGQQTLAGRQADILKEQTTQEQELNKIKINMAQKELDNIDNKTEYELDMLAAELKKAGLVNDSLAQEIKDAKALSPYRIKEIQAEINAKNRSNTGGTSSSDIYKTTSYIDDVRAEAKVIMDSAGYTEKFDAKNGTVRKPNLSYDEAMKIAEDRLSRYRTPNPTSSSTGKLSLADLLGDMFK